MNDKWLRIIGYPILIPIMAMIFHEDALWRGGIKTVHSLATSGIFTIVLWEGNRWVFKQMLQRLPGYLNTLKRIVGEVSLSMLYSVLIQLVLELIFFYWLDMHPAGTPPIDWWACILISLLALIPMGLIYEAGYFFSEWKKNIQRSEALARSQVQAQLDALKKQLDPHFLFNSLNTLAYLIDLENDPAQEYLVRLSKVYRYVLDTRIHSTVSLKDELDFLNDYLYLNQVRYRDNLKVVHELDPATQQKQIPALSLQLLIENAIKHNTVSPDYPLAIHISTDEDGILVTNNKQPKKGLVPSTKIGLNNLREQYRLLTSRSIEIIDAEREFSVKLPFVA